MTTHTLCSQCGYVHWDDDNYSRCFRCRTQQERDRLARELSLPEITVLEYKRMIERGEIQT